VVCIASIDKVFRRNKMTVSPNETLVVSREITVACACCGGEVELIVSTEELEHARANTICQPCKSLAQEEDGRLTTLTDEKETVSPNETLVVSKKEVKSLDIPEDRLVYIGRPSRWGNPFVIGRDGNRAEVIRKYQLWFQQQDMKFYEDLSKLKGKVLVCFCAPLPCHGDVIKEFLDYHDYCPDCGHWTEAGKLHDGRCYSCFTRPSLGEHCLLCGEEFPLNPYLSECPECSEPTC
jgi:hypothetical protein